MQKKLPFWMAAVACVFSASAVVAQERAPLVLGVKGGVPFAKLSVEDDQGADIENRTGFGGGGFLRVPLGGVGLQIEVLYVQKGASQTSGDIDPFDEITIALDYIEVPVLLTLPFATGGAASPYVFAGPAFAFEVGCSMQGDSPALDFDIDCEGDPQVDFELQTKSLDIGATFGAGLNLPAGPGTFLLEGRYTLGFVNINDAGDESVKNRAFMAQIGFSFPVGGARN